MSIVRAAISGSHPGQPRRLLFLGSLLALGPVSLWAQSKTLVEVPPPGTAEEAVELTPFYVNEEESGYRATSTLAGTRLKTDLKDIGAAVSVVTNEMMSDLGAVNLEDILVFTTGTEVGGISGNFLGDGLDRNGDNSESRTNPSDNNRVRGLAKVTNTRDYFVTDIPFNQYNSSALTISRGPNAILAGAGSPGGVIDRGLKTATFKDRTEITARIGSNGAHRQTLGIQQSPHSQPAERPAGVAQRGPAVQSGAGLHAGSAAVRRADVADPQGRTRTISGRYDFSHQLRDRHGGGHPAQSDPAGQRLRVLLDRQSTAVQRRDQCLLQPNGCGDRRDRSHARQRLL
jgi:hypothetical protein